MKRVARTWRLMALQDTMTLLQSVQDRLGGGAGASLREQAAFVRTLHDEVLRHRGSSKDVAELEAQLDEEVSRLRLMLDAYPESIGLQKAAGTTDVTRVAS
jgi:hypothetical protein